MRYACGRLHAMLKRFLNDESGATMVEYGIMVALIAIAVSIAVLAITAGINHAFNTIVNCIHSAGSGNESDACAL